MDRKTDPTSDFDNRLRGLKSGVTTACADIADLLARKDSLDGGRIESLCLQVKKHAMALPSLATDLQAARTADVAKAETRTEAIHLSQKWASLQHLLGEAQRSLNQWHAIERMIRDQISQIKTPLYTNVAPTEHSKNVLTDDLLHALHRVLNPIEQDEGAGNYGCFPDISLPNSVFAEHLHAAYRVCLAQNRTKPIRFLDVGCGGGLKVLSAAQAVGQSDGLEFDPGYVQVARKLLEMAGTENAQVFQADALTFEDYGDYDIIYFYRPMRDAAQLQVLEQRILEQASAGTILIAPYIDFIDRYRDLNCSLIDGMIYLANSDQDTADRLRALAERTGPVIVKPERSDLLSWWAPIINVSRRAGFDLHDRYKRVQH